LPTAKTICQILASDYRGLVGSTIPKFDDIPANINTRASVIVLVDEAHRIRLSLSDSQLEWNQFDETSIQVDLQGRLECIEHHSNILKALASPDLHRLAQDIHASMCWDTADEHNLPRGYRNLVQVHGEVGRQLTQPFAPAELDGCFETQVLMNVLSVGHLDQAAEFTPVARQPMQTVDARVVFQTNP
jgi:hypothetical protein